jgi:DNA-binding NarL/FixJ family response regulator
VNNLLDHIFKREKKSTREIAVMHFVDGMTLKEVADEVGLSVSGVRKRIRELRSRVQTGNEYATHTVGFVSKNTKEVYDENQHQKNK